MINLVEFQNFGINLITATFIATLFFTVLWMRSLFQQNQKIVRNPLDKAESVSFIFYAYYGFSALAIVIYGFDKNSLALVVNGLSGFMALLIVFNLWRLKEISLREKIIGLSSILTIPIMLLNPQKDLLYFIFSVAFGLVIIEQIREIWHNKSSGLVDPRPIVISLLSAIFWSTYGAITDIWPLKIMNGVGAILWIILLASYIKFKPKKILLWNKYQMRKLLETYSFALLILIRKRKK